MRSYLVLTDAEKRAISDLKRLEKRWPDSLWLFSASGRLHVMRKIDGERCVTSSGGMDQSRSVAVIDIENDGGDW